MTWELCHVCEILADKDDLCRSCYACANCGHEEDCPSDKMDADDWESLAAEADAIFDSRRDGDL